MQNILIIGWGKVGSSLFNLLRALNRHQIFVLDTKKEYEQQWADYLPAEAFFTRFEDLRHRPFNLVAICTPDDQIASLLPELKQMSLNGCQVFHTSGSKSANVLQPLKERGALVGSFHPLQTFNAMFLPAELWRNIICTFQGDAALFEALRDLLQKFQVRIVKITAQQKQMLHLAATIAANFQVALYSWAEQLLSSGGLEAHNLNEWLGPLIRQVTENLKAQPIEKILSGPVQRGDLSTLAEHLEILKKQPASHDAELYRLLSLKLLENERFPINRRSSLKKFLEQYET